MAGNAVAKNGSANKAIVAATAEVVTNVARSAAGELVKGQQPLRDVVRIVASDAVEEIEKRGPELAKNAGIMTWRYAALGWITWQVGKRVVKRKAKGAVSRSPKGGQSDA
jgi:hypothetical protein